MGEAPWWDDKAEDETYASQAISASYSVINGLVDNVSEGVNMLGMPLVSDGGGSEQTSRRGASRNTSQTQGTRSDSLATKKKNEWSFSQAQGGASQHAAKQDAAESKIAWSNNPVQEDPRTSQEQLIPENKGRSSPDETRKAEDKMADDEPVVSKYEPAVTKTLLDSMAVGYGIPMSTPPPSYKTVLDDTEEEVGMQFPIMEVSGDPVRSTVPERYCVALNYCNEKHRKRDIPGHFMGNRRYLPSDLRGTGMELVMHEGDIRVKGVDARINPGLDKIGPGDRLVRIHDRVTQLDYQILSHSLILSHFISYLLFEVDLVLKSH